MGLRKRISRNRDIRNNEPIRDANEAREKVSSRAQRSRRVGVGLLTLAIGFGVLGAESTGTQPRDTGISTAAENQKPSNEPLSRVADLGLIGTAGAAYAERKLLRRSTRQTVRKFRAGQGIPTGGEFELKLVEADDGTYGFEKIPSFVGADTPNIDLAAGLPSLGGWLSGMLIDHAASGATLEHSVRVGVGTTGAVFLAGTVVVEGMMHKNISLIEQDALQRIDQLDPNVANQ